jgi:hypothetical protein
VEPVLMDTSELATMPNMSESWRDCREKMSEPAKPDLPTRRRGQQRGTCRWSPADRLPTWRSAIMHVPSSREGSHLPALTEPCVKVAPYTALVALIIRPVRHS